jgi:hypothetical protein
MLDSELAKNLYELYLNMLLETLAEYLIGWFASH